MNVFVNSYSGQLISMFYEVRTVWVTLQMHITTPIHRQSSHGSSFEKSLDSATYTETIAIVEIYDRSKSAITTIDSGCNDTEP